MFTLLECIFSYSICHLICSLYSNIYLDPKYLKKVLNFSKFFSKCHEKKIKKKTKIPLFSDYHRKYFRVARNGDTANKIGTYSLAVLANYHK